MSAKKVIKKKQQTTTNEEELVNSIINSAIDTSSYLEKGVNEHSQHQNEVDDVQTMNTEYQHNTIDEEQYDSSDDEQTTTNSENQSNSMNVDNTHHTESLSTSNGSIEQVSEILKEETKTNILSPIITRFKRDLWIPDEPIGNLISATRNTLNNGSEVSELPDIYLYPIVLEQDSSNQTGDNKYKNLIGINEYGILTKEQMTTTFKCLNDFPNWQKCFVPLREVLIDDENKEFKNYPIYVPCSNYILLEQFSCLIRAEIFRQTCS
jgi:hypothetical protein